MVIAPAGLNPIGQDIMKGMEEHFGECFGAYLSFFKIDPYSLFDIEIRMVRFLDRFRSDELFKPLPEDCKVSDAIDLLDDFLDASLWYLAETIQALDVNLITDAIKMHSLSVKSLAQFNTSLLHLCVESDGSDSGTGSPVDNGRKGAILRHAPRDELIEHTKNLYLSKGWKSKMDAAKRITPKVIEYDRLRFQYLKETNAENTVYKWIRENITTSG